MAGVDAASGSPIGEDGVATVVALELIHDGSDSEEALLGESGSTGARDDVSELLDASGSIGETDATGAVGADVATGTNGFGAGADNDGSISHP